MNVFQVSPSDYWVASEEKKAYLEYKKWCIGEGFYHDWKYTPRELTDSEMEDFKFISPNGIEEMSFRQKLNQMLENKEQFNEPFATSEF